MAGKADVIRRANELVATTAPKCKPMKVAQFDAIFRVIFEMVRDGERINVQHFGTFEQVQRSPRRVWDSEAQLHKPVAASVRLRLRTKVKFAQSAESEST